MRTMPAMIGHPSRATIGGRSPAVGDVLAGEVGIKRSYRAPETGAPNFPRPD